MVDNPRSRANRLLMFFIVFGGTILVLLTISALLTLQALNPGSRNVAQALAEGVTVREFAALPDDNAYPATIAVGADGTLYTASYVTGAIWRINATGGAEEIPGTRDTLASVAALAAGPDGMLYIIDQGDADPRTKGGSIKRMAADGTITDFVATLPDENGFVAPDDLVFDSEGNLYVSDRGRIEVWRFAPDGAGSLWWTPPAGETIAEPTGLAYDAATDTILVTDPMRNTVYQTAVTSGETTVLYEHGTRENPPGFDGIDAANGVIYTAALGQNGIATLENGELQYIAGPFRGGSDVVYSDGRLYVTNFDQFSLVLAAVRPQLPFALDVVVLPDAS